MGDDATTGRRRMTVGSLEATLRSIAGMDAAASSIARMASKISADQAASFSSAAAQLASIEMPRLTVPGIIAASEALRGVALPRFDATALLGAATPEPVACVCLPRCVRSVPAPAPLSTVRAALDDGRI